MPTRRQPLADADPDTLRNECVAALRAGELCVLPTETVYGLGCLPSDHRAVQKLRACKHRSERQPFTWHLADATDLDRLGARLPLPAERLIARYWPGPLTLILPGKDGGTIGARLPAHEFTRAVIRAAGEPLWLTSVNDSGQPPLVEPDAIAARCADQGVALFVDDGPSPLGTASTIVRATDGALEVLREGILSRQEILSTAADLILFVCTGNTCRSPLAEAIAREATAQAMGVPVEQVLQRGLRFASAGTATVLGMPASDGSAAAAAEIGLDLSAHQSQPIDPELLRQAERIYCLSDSHRRALLAEAPDVADKVSLLRPDDRDIADPYGSDLPAYQRARDEIRAAVAARLGDWWP